MKKVVLKLDLHDDKDKKKAMRTVSSISGIDSISMDMKEQKLTVMGEVDPVEVVNKLRKSWHTEIFSVGPATKEPEKKKDDQPSSNNKKGGGGGGEGGSGGEKSKDQESGGNKNKGGGGGGGGGDGDQRRPQMMTQAHYPNEHMMPPVDLVRTYQAYQQYQPPGMATHYYVQSAEENPNACVIC